jgi:hypothetical protein
MPNRKLVPRVAATRPGRRKRRRRGSRRGGGSAWWRAIKVAVLLERIRTRRSSPSYRQIALVIVTGGLAIMIIRTAARKAKSRPGVAEVNVSEVGAQADSPDDDAPAAAERNDTATGTERRFTDRVQQEMFRRADAPTQAGGSGSG